MKIIEAVEVYHDNLVLAVQYGHSESEEANVIVRFETDEGEVTDFWVDHSEFFVDGTEVNRPSYLHAEVAIFVRRNINKDYIQNVIDPINEMRITRIIIDYDKNIISD